MLKYKNTVKYNVILFIMVLPFSLWGASTIPNISDITLSGQKIIISGSGFGDHANYGSSSGLMFAWNNFETGIVNNDGFVASKASTGEQGWSTISGSSNKTNSHYYARRIDARADHSPDNMGGLKKPSTGSVSLGGSTVVFSSFWFKIPHTSSSGKHHRYSGFGDAFGTTGGSDFYNRFTVGESTQWTSKNQFLDNIWQRVDMLMDISAGTITTWTVGQNNNNPQWARSYSLSGTTFQVNLGAGKDWSSYTATGGDEYDYDDVYIDFTQARVEIGNASTWSACTRREIQIPTTWTSNSITVNVNQGSFMNGSTAYLYVVDSNGNVNANGYPITISGQSTSSDTTPPSSPSGVNVQIIQ